MRAHSARVPPPPRPPNSTHRSRYLRPLRRAPAACAATRAGRCRRSCGRTACRPVHRACPRLSAPPPPPRARQRSKPRWRTLRMITPCQGTPAARPCGRTPTFVNLGDGRHLLLLATARLLLLWWGRTGGAARSPRELDLRHRVICAHCGGAHTPLAHAGASLWRPSGRRAAGCPPGRSVRGRRRPSTLRQTPWCQLNAPCQYRVAGKRPASCGLFFNRKTERPVTRNAPRRRTWNALMNW